MCQTDGSKAELQEYLLNYSLGSYYVSVRITYNLDILSQMLWSCATLGMYVVTAAIVYESTESSADICATS